MKNSRHYFYFLICFFFMTMLSGCSLLQLPGQMIGGLFFLLGKLVDLAIAMPKPPPGIFF